jgi:ABC-type multidrug transport system fused ATPase/permease subunit
MANDTATNTDQKTPEDTKKKVDYRQAWKQVRALLWARRYRLMVGFLLLLVNRASGFVLPASTKFLVDNIIGQNREDLLPWLAAAAVAATLVQAASGFALALVLGVAAQRSINDLRIQVHHHVSRLPISYFDDRKSGELMSRVMNDAEGIRNLVGNGIVQLIGGLLTAGLALLVLFWLNWRLTLVTLVMVALFGVLMAWGFRYLRPIFRERNQLIAEVTGRLGEMLGGIRVVKAYTAEKREERIFAGGTHRLLRNIVRSMVGVTSITTVAGLLLGLTGTAMSVVGAREVLAGRMTVGDILMYVVFTGLVVAPLVQISAIGTQVTEAFAGLDRIREVLSEPTERQLTADCTPLGRVRGDVAMEAVHFEYKADTPVLKGVSFLAPAGTTTALVGPSGGGKSTLISLIMAFNKPTAGRVLIDGQDLQEIRLHDFRSQLGIVLQDNFLFAGTIHDNIAYANPHASEEEIHEAARIAHCDEFIEGFEDGYATVIGERGVKLSGGQRQRIAIARAILANPRLLILDEATSSLDSDSEEKIQDGLEALLKGRTTFVIAHRLSTILSADQILVIDDGNIVERGTCAELLEQGGLFKGLYDKQYRLERNRFINPGEDTTPEPVKVEMPAAPSRRRPKL